MDKFRRRLAPGDTLFEQGEHGDCAYIVESGVIEIVCDDASGKAAKVLARLGSQDIFGEMALFGERTRSAGARAAGDAVLTVVTHDYLTERLQASDPMLRHLLRTLTKRLRGMNNGAATTAAGSGAKAADGEVGPAKDDEDRNLALSRVRAEQDLTVALEQEQFRLYFQPIHRLSDGSIAGYEALIRWLHPERGLVPPVQFIPLAEESDLIVRMGHWITDRACAALSEFEALRKEKNLRIPPLFMSLNLSGRQFQDPDLLPTLDRTLARYPVDPQQIKLEVTESLMLRAFDESVRLLKDCRSRGVKVSLDDFGTGYSSLSYLHRLPVNTLKLDRSFVLALDVDDSGRKILAAIVRLAHDLGMDVITEGIETLQQSAVLRELGSDMAQGYYFGKPVPQATAMETLQNHP
ncbi:MAG: EAL domain-containing protein [Nevskia sp.]|nr:EAL domain-containing protein [Nevskia sp.]